MTVRTVESDFRTPVTTGCGSQLAGSYSLKVQNGTNSPPGTSDQENPYTMSYLYANDVVSHWTHTGWAGWPDNPNWVSCVDNYPSFEIPTLDANDMIKLVDKLGRKTRGHDFNLAVTLGEGRMSLKLIMDTARVVAASVKEMRRGNVVGAARDLGITGTTLHSIRNDLAGAYLAVRYGVSPLLADVKAAGEAFAALREKHETVVKVSLRKRGRVYSPSGYTCKGSCWAGMRIKAKITEGFSTADSLSMYDVPSALWELAPWSFVGDWFVPIGRYLSAVNTVNNLTAQYVVSKRTVAEGRVVSYPLPLVLREPHSYVSQGTLVREVTSSLSVPPPKFVPLNKVFTREDRITKESVPFYQRVMDAVALAVQCTK